MRGMEFLVNNRREPGNAGLTAETQRTLRKQINDVLSAFATCIILRRNSLNGTA